MSGIMQLKTHAFAFEVKSLDDVGTFEGYGSVFGNVDGGRDVVVKGAFTRSLQERAAIGRKLPILWQHRSGEPIGVYEDVKEDDHGLWMKGRLLVADVQRAKEAHALMKAGAVTGMSIGYRTVKDRLDSKTGVTYLEELGLEETSVVTFPMNDIARVAAVKAEGFMRKFRAAGGKASMAEFEEFLREAGFSNTEAKAIAGGGFRESFLREAGGKGKSSNPMTDVLSGFKLTP